MYFQPTGPYTTSTSLKQVLKDSPIQNPVGPYVVAAMLNNKEGSVPQNILGLQTIKDIWAEFANTTFFTPGAGGKWSAAEIVDYLKTTMPS